MKKAFIIILLMLSCISYSSDILVRHGGVREAPVVSTAMLKPPRIPVYKDISKNDLLENLKDNLEITHIFNPFCIDYFSAKNLHLIYDEKIVEDVLDKLMNDNSLYVLRLGYYFNPHVLNSDFALKSAISKIKSEYPFRIERSILLHQLGYKYSQSTSEKLKQEAESLLVYLWDNSNDQIDLFSLSEAYFRIRRELNYKYDNRINKLGETFYRERSKYKYPKYFKFLSRCINKSYMYTNPDYSPHYKINELFNIIDNSNVVDASISPWYKDAYYELIKENQPLDADFIFYWLRSSKKEIMIDLAREHIQNPDFKDARYKTVYYLVNHDFDYSFPILTNMVNNNSLHINEKKNFYRGLARLNKVSHSVLTKEQQQQANDYLLSQMHSEQDIAIKLYIDFLLSICVDEYGLSDGRTAFLNSLKETDTISQEDIAQIDRRLKIIKYSIYMHSPSIFESYVNGLKTEKPFVDVTKVDIHMLPVYEAKANGETWYYHDVNSEAYIAYNTNKYMSLNLTLPQTLGIFPVVGITEGAFGSSWHSCTNIVIPKSVTYISYQAFAYNTNLLSIAIPNTVTNIGYSAFKRSNNISMIFLEEGSIFEDKHLYNDRDLTPNCKIIRTKFEKGLPVIPPEGESEAESP